MLIRLLGPVDVVDDDGTVHGSTSAIRRTLLALFAVHVGQVLSPDWLLEHLWGGEVPGSGVRALRFHISHLRRELGGLDLVETCPGGYRLRVSPSEVDIGVVESLESAAREETDDGCAVRLCSEALASWRGTPFVDALPSSDLADEAARLDELRLTVTELSYRRRLDAGEGSELVAGLVRLTGEFPLRERLWHVLIAAQYRAGRQADALRSYDAVRSILIETLGVDPSTELQELQRRVLQHDPKLSASRARQTDEVALMLWDVADSTGLLVRQGQAGVAALGRVVELVEAVAGEHGGRVSTSQGESDGAVVLFSSVAQAAAAAVEVNARMSDESWPEGERVRIRGAVHVGEITATPEGVFGVEVHRCARLRALAVGGEVFLSDAAMRTVGQHLPVDSSVFDEGVVVLRGFAEPERVWRLVHPALRSRDGPLVAAASPGELPMWRTSFVGRSAEVSFVAARLAAGRVVTLVGPAGVGKTRLAVVVASEAPVRTCFVDLTRATSDGEVVAIAADALGADPASHPLTGIEAVLATAPALVVLDNCEHVLAAAASLVEHLLSRCESSSVLATSRATLRVPGEDVVVVAPLQTAPGRAATQLFLDRALVAPGALTTNEIALAEITAITDLLDGVPLAIELAAARATAFSVGEIHTLLQHDLAGLDDARRRGPDRHRSVRAAIEWSMRMLTDDERGLLCRLAVLPGSFRLSTAIAVATTGRVDDRALVAAIPSLIEQSLVTTERGPGSTRYRVLEIIRAVGQDALGVDARRDVLDRLLSHCIDELDVLSGHVLPQPGLEAEIARDGALHSAAVGHALATEQIEDGLRLVHNLFPAWHGVTKRMTLDRWMNELLARAEAPSRTRARVLRRQAIITSEDFGDDERWTRLLDAAEADAIAVADRQLLGMVRATRAGLNLGRGRGALDELDDNLRDAIGLLEESGDEYVSNALSTLAELLMFRAQFDQADEVLARALEAKPTWFQRGHIEQARAWCALRSGRIESAAGRAATTLELAERSEDAELISHAVEVAAYAALARGETGLAAELFVRMVTLTREHELSDLSFALIGLATVSVLRGNLEVARSCRDEFLLRQQMPVVLVAVGRLACAFVDLADGDPDAAARAATEVLHDAELRLQPYFHVLSLELLAAAIASSDPQQARELLSAADQERSDVGATAWPLEPYRHVALRALETFAADAPPPRRPECAKRP